MTPDQIDEILTIKVNKKAINKYKKKFNSAKSSLAKKAGGVSKAIRSSAEGIKKVLKRGALPESTEALDAILDCLTEEQLSELHKKTVASYLKKAKDSRNASERALRTTDDPEKALKATQKFLKRRKGIARAHDTMEDFVLFMTSQMENLPEEFIVELKDATLKSYVSKVHAKVKDGKISSKDIWKRTKKVGEASSKIKEK